MNTFLDMQKTTKKQTNKQKTEEQKTVPSCLSINIILLVITTEVFMVVIMNSQIVTLYPSAP